MTRPPRISQPRLNDPAPAELATAADVAALQAEVDAVTADAAAAQSDADQALADAASVTTSLSDHIAAADPHTGYQKESEKAAANGYASLGSAGYVPTAQLLCPYDQGNNFTIPTGHFIIWSNRFTLAGSKRLTMQGTGRLRIT